MNCHYKIEIPIRRGKARRADRVYPRATALGQGFNNIFSPERAVHYLHSMTLPIKGEVICNLISRISIPVYTRTNLL